MLNACAPGGIASASRAPSNFPVSASNHRVERPLGSHSPGCFIRRLIGSPGLRGLLRMRNSASGKRARAVVSIAVQSGSAASGPPLYFGGSSAFAVSATGPNGATTIAAKGRKIIIVPVTTDSRRSGATTMPRSRCWVTIAGRVIRFGHRRNLKVLRVRHHRITPEMTKNNPASPAMPITHSPASPVNRWWWKSNSQISGRSHWLAQRATTSPDWLA